ncbi:MAG: PAS domain S-box protein [Melioribacteraceae bacterium]
MDTFRNLFKKIFTLLKKPHYKIALIYLTISILWIIYSDKIAFELSPEQESFKYIQSVKGLFFIFATSIIIFLLIRNDYRTIKEKNIQLNDSKIKMQLAFDASNIGTYQFDLENEIIYLDPRSQIILGIYKNELNLSEIINKIHPNDINYLSELLGKTNHLKEDLKLSATHRIVFENKDVRWIESAIIFSQNEDNGSKKINWGIGTLLDITEKKKSTEQLTILQYALENANIGVFKIDEDGKINYVNKYACENLGYSKKEITSLSIMNIDKGLTLESFKKQRKNIHNSFETTHTCKDGSRFPVEVTLNYFNYENELQAVYFAKDITARMEAENELKKTQNQLRALFANIDNIREDERKILARELHDELGQVLTSLNMNLSLLKNNIEHNLYDEKQLISDLDEISQIVNASKINIKKIIRSLRPEYLDNLGLIPALNHLIEEYQKSKNININFIHNFDEANIDSQKENIVYRVIQESLTNITKHAHATNVEVNLFLDEGKLKVIINDDGIGINLKDINKENSFGLIGMKERLSQIGSELEINGNQNSGTNLNFVITL